MELRTNTQTTWNSAHANNTHTHNREAGTGYRHRLSHSKGVDYGGTQKRSGLKRELKMKEPVCVPKPFST